MATSATILPAPRLGFSLVIDVSAAQPATFDFEAAHAAGAVAAMIKATEGETYRDPLAPPHRRRAVNAGLMAGSYHVFRPEHADPAIQAERYHDAAYSETMLGPIADVELLEGIAPALVAQRALAFVRRSAELWQGTTGLVYASPAFLAQLSTSPAGRAAVAEMASIWPLWLAQYAPAPSVPAPWTRWRGWQFSGGRKTTGNSETSVGGVLVDASWFVGTAADVAALGAS